MSAELRLRDVAVTLGGVRILDGVSLDVHAGETFGIIGPNGAGKTTVLNAISGVVPLQAGSVELDGVDLARTRPHRRRELGIGRSLQTTQYYRVHELRGRARHRSAPRGAGERRGAALVPR
jgi:branched-chain amino acid transport system ATP-binding protein